MYSHIAGTHDVDDNIKKDIVDRLQPSESIKKLKLEGYDGLIFPPWLGNPSYTNMVFIELTAKSYKRPSHVNTNVRRVCFSSNS